MGVRRGGQEGALAPPPGRAKLVCFLDFFGKNSIFFVVFKAKSRFLPPPLENFWPPLEKSLRTPMSKHTGIVWFRALNIFGNDTNGLKNNHLNTFTYHVWVWKPDPQANKFQLFLDSECNCLFYLIVKLFYLLGRSNRWYFKATGWPSSGPRTDDLYKNRLVIVSMMK